MLFTSRDITSNYLINRRNLKRESNSAPRALSFYPVGRAFRNARFHPRARARWYIADIVKN